MRLDPWHEHFARWLTHHFGGARATPALLYEKITEALIRHVQAGRGSLANRVPLMSDDEGLLFVTESDLRAIARDWGTTVRGLVAEHRAYRGPLLT